MAKLIARLLATAALWVRFLTSLKILNGRHKQRSGQHTLARKKYTKKSAYRRWMGGGGCVEVIVNLLKLDRDHRDNLQTP